MRPWTRSTGSSSRAAATSTRSCIDANPHPETDAPRAARDAAELAMPRAALDRDMPVLAICRGSQALNVARGGDLVQHLPDEVGHERHKHQPGEFSDHDVKVAPGSARLAARRARAGQVHHHQGFGRIGEGLWEVAWAEDGAVEGLEDPEKHFALGVLSTRRRARTMRSSRPWLTRRRATRAERR